MASTSLLTGHCLCGALRYRFDPTNAVVDYCHCDTCRRWSGAPVTAWAQVPPAQFELLAGTAKIFQSSPLYQRHFCGDCGSPIYMSGGDTIGIMLGTVDDASGLIPTGHGWTSAQLPWLKIDDHLPHWPKDAPHDAD
ncbi:MAG: GFA family protein [Rhodospirillaceae bacterium]|nr:GFA family protein [Rhodospirillaceae bacterium]